MSDKTLEQRRAAAAWQAVGEVQDAFKGEYLTLAKGAPADIQTNGLGQTLAFWFAKRDAKKGSAHGLLFDHVSRWVLGEMGAANQPSLLAWIQAVDSDAYRRATMEALAYLVWIKRFAEGLLGQEKEPDHD